MNVKTILIFAGGAAVGAVASFFVTKKFVEDKCAKIYMDKRLDKVKDKAEEPKTDKNLENSGKNEEKSAKKEENLDKWKPKVTSSDLLSARNDAVAIVSDNEYYVQPAQPCEETGNPLPYLIEEDDFGVSADYETDDITWWLAGGCATDMNYDKIENIDEIVGMANINALVDAHQLYGYVRNEALKKEYTIVLTDEDPPLFLEED